MGSYPQVPCDTECYRNYWLCKFREPDGSFREFEIRPGRSLPSVMVLRMYLAMHEVVTFNGNNYDVPMIAAACHLLNSPHLGPHEITRALKAYSDSIIVGRVRSWEFYKLHNVPEIQNLKHIDLFEVAPGVGIGLKMYMCRMGSRTIQDLPVDPSADLTEQEMDGINWYCGNDLQGTYELAQECKKRLDVRRAIGAEYGIDVMSKSDAQIAESVIKAQLPFRPQKEVYPHGYQFHYVAPDFIRFETQQMNDVLRTILTTPFTVNDTSQLKTSEDDVIYDSDGKKVKTGIIIPAAIAGTDIRIGDSVYRLGIGGLHSSEKSVWYRSEPGKWSLDDFDVGSYYPSLILLMNMYPRAIGPDFIKIYRKVYEDRLHAKRMGASGCADAKDWKVKADSLKITLNGAFGKLGSKYSILFAPELLIRTTITGQLALLMLIEALEQRGIPVVSANTDGIILKTPAGMEAFRDSIIKWWEQSTGLEMEQTPYTAIFNRDVNNYIAFKPDGKWKAKGCFGESGVSPAASPSGKHPDREICAEAVIAYLAHGTPLYTTIRACRDIKKFVTVRQVGNGGGVWEGDGQYLGKAVRWYYGRNSHHAIRSAKLNTKGVGNMVAGSTGSVPCMVLPDTLPDDIDYGYYEREAYKMLLDIGVVKAA